MTAHRRNRKFTHTRRNTDDDSYTERYRRASDGAKAARAAARGETTGGSDRSGEEARRGLAVEVGQGARIKSVSLVEDFGTGYITHLNGEELKPLNEVNLEDYNCGVGVYFVTDSTKDALEEYRDSLEFKHASARLLEATFPSGWRERVSEEALEGDYVINVGGEAHRSAGDQEGLRTQTSPHAETFGERCTPDAPADVHGAYQQVHRIFFEAEVNGLPTHVGTDICGCPESGDHWKVLGEN